MTAREYLQKMINANQVTFIIEHAEKDEHSPFYHSAYTTTAIRGAWEWLEDFTWIDHMLVINADHPPIDVTGNWLRAYKAGHLHCAVVTTEDDIRRHYPNAEQAQRMIDYYKETVR